MNQIVYTVGHSNGTVERLLELLNLHDITAVADVRSRPYSRFNPQFNREGLAHGLKTAGLEYVFLGQELGARSADPACYRSGRAQYSLIAKTPVFELGIKRLLAGMERFRVAILCAEKEPLGCHRDFDREISARKKCDRAAHSRAWEPRRSRDSASTSLCFARHRREQSFSYQGRTGGASLREAGRRNRVLSEPGVAAGLGRGGPRS